MIDHKIIAYNKLKLYAITVGSAIVWKQSYLQLDILLSMSGNGLNQTTVAETDFKQKLNVRFSS